MGGVGLALSGREGLEVTLVFGAGPAPAPTPWPPMLLLELVADFRPVDEDVAGAGWAFGPFRFASLRCISSIILPPPPPPPIGPFEEAAGEGPESEPPPDLEPAEPFRALRFLSASAMLIPAPAPPPPPPRPPPPLSGLFEVANEKIT